MFKLGGQADQGTGIMSTVEPKKTIRQNPYTGYAVGGRIGYAQAGQVTDPFTYFAPSNIPKAGIPRIAETRDMGFSPFSRMQEKFKSMPSIIPFKEDIDLDNLLIQEGLLSKNAPITEILAARELYKTRGIQDTTDQKLGLGLDNLSANFGAGISGRNVEKELLEKKVNIPSPGMKDNKYTETDTSKPFNLLDEVKKESGELRELLGRDEGTLTAEAALVLSEALGTPGTIAEKIQKGLKAAVPLKKARAEQDKAITLTAYKLAKEKEQQQIRAGTLPTSIREAEYIARSLKESGDPRYADMSIQQIMNENIRAAKPLSPESKARTEVLLADRQVIRDATNSLLQDKNNLDKLDPVKDKAKYDKTKELYDKKFKEFERDYLSAPEFKSLYEGIYNIFAPQMTSRTMKAVGGLTEDEKEPDVIASNVNFGGTTTPIKPVQKLDYATLRDRLPKEINNQVVQLLASSEQALQDFAYITSQNDVNNFNVKYGVNLIIPPAQQTS
jgi:hypothetical protein